ncbi:MAG: exodeoxyribonuclease VII small subunit [Christensenella sp.]|uniref:exodeoxyribonuclease VII small subunit n=1 Tax=Christensenella sp. TaxID=1935934 RepID=UPI002B207B04|nr:exodeoxyribonuclease VII small subunit [Christensenella sp.]MEA5004590.1 exodeoxyribonuclease VII small subunit [Christensenella sp.]
MPEKDLEAYIEELKEISEKISQEDIKLADAVTLYKKGVTAADKASKLLKKYESELEIIKESEMD